MITIDGHAVLSRADIHQEYGYALSTLEGWWADRKANGHPDARKLGNTLYWDAEEWRTWDRERNEAPAGWLTRDQLAAEHGYSRPHLAKLWADRESNGHPPAARYGGVMHWHSPTWGAWHKQHQAAAADHRRPVAPAKAQAAGDPHQLIGPAEFGRILGQADGSWVSRAVTAPPPGFPKPDDWGDVEAGKRPKWRRSRAVQYARDRTKTAPARPGRPQGTRTGQTPYAGDPRLTLARQSLAEHPDDTTRQHIRRLAQTSTTPTSESAWTKIILSARAHPEDDA